MKIQSNGTAVVNGVTFQSVYAISEAGDKVYVLMRSSEISKLFNSSVSFFNNIAKKATQKGTELVEEEDFVWVSSEDLVSVYGSCMKSVGTVKMYTKDGFAKVVDNGFNEFTQERTRREAEAIKQYFADTETSISKLLNVKATTSDIQSMMAQMTAQAKTGKETAKEESPVEICDSEETLAEEVQKTTSSLSKEAATDNAITLNGEPLSDKLLEPFYDELNSKYGDLFEPAGKPVRMGQKKGIKGNKHQVKEAGKSVKSQFTAPAPAPENGALEYLKKAVSAEPENEKATPVSDPVSVMNITTPFPTFPEPKAKTADKFTNKFVDKFADKSTDKNDLTKVYQTAEKIRKYAESLDKKEYPDEYAAIMMMASAVLASGNTADPVLHPVKTPKKALFSTESVALAFKTSPEVINQIATEMDMRRKKYGKSLILVEVGDIVLSRFYYNKKAIRKFSEILIIGEAVSETSEAE